jgi:glycerol-1-phosphate dehydrogenase [NAD(P)+]
MKMHDIIDTYCDFLRVDDAGREYKTRTQFVRVQSGVNENCADLLGQYLGVGPIAVFLDENTRRVAGDSVIRSLEAAGYEVKTFELQPQEAGEPIVCDDGKIAEVEAILRAATYSHAVAVGAGTINDVVKMASFTANVDYSVVGTAPSMNGYTSAIAAILSEGVKTTQACRAPIAALADPKVMAEAPYRMIASGLGDLYSKPVSNADWRLSHRLLGTFHSPIVMEIVNAAAEILDGVAPTLPERDEDSVARLTGAIMLSGLAMQAAGTSGPASGGEHLVSHYVDMTSIAYDLPHDFHGCQVAVGTMATSTLYAEVRAIDPSAIDIEACVAAHIEWEDYEPIVRERFGPLADAVITHAAKMYPTKDEVRERLTRVVENWDDLFEDVGVTLREPADLGAELESAKCPTRFAEIGVDYKRALSALKWCKDIRARYTILHLASELGVLDDFADRYIATNFAS